MADEDTALGEAADAADIAEAAEAASNTKALDAVARSGFAVMALLRIVLVAVTFTGVKGARKQNSAGCRPHRATARGFRPRPT